MASAPTSRRRTESNSDVGDKANDAIRIDGSDLRVRVVGEGGNLGFTQLGRVEARAAGVRINTDAIDNSAGVDTSDHEVNIKILLDAVVRSGDLTQKQRNELLAEMTDDVAAHVLEHNYDQNVLLSNARAQTHSMLPVHKRFIRRLEERGELDRAARVPAIRRRDRPSRRGRRRAHARRSSRCSSPTPRWCWPTTCSTARFLMSRTSSES